MVERRLDTAKGPGSIPGRSTYIPWRGGRMGRVAGFHPGRMRVRVLPPELSPRGSVGVGGALTRRRSLVRSQPGVRMTGCPSGQGAACKAVHAGSNPASVSRRCHPLWSLRRQASAPAVSHKDGCPVRVPGSATRCERRPGSAVAPPNVTAAPSTGSSGSRWCSQSTSCPATSWTARRCAASRAGASTAGLPPTLRRP